MYVKQAKVQSGFKIRPDLMERIREQSKRHEVPQVRIVEKALEEYITKLEKKEPVV